MLEIRLLGTFDIRDGKKSVSIASRPAQSLFAYLVLSAGTAHRREKLAGMLWPDSLEETARENLRHALWRLRKGLQSGSATHFLHADDLTISFEKSAEYWFDVAGLENLNENTQSDELMASLSEYRGELLPGFYDEWVVLQREHLHSIFEHHMARLLSLLEKEKRWLDILDWGERWIKLGQKPEPAYRALMSAHAAKGDMSNVAATYERCVKALRVLGMEPSNQTQMLYEDLKLGKEIPKTVSLLPKSAAKELPSNLPVPLTTFIGRQAELKEITNLLSSSRLLTLTGSGGVGKTRLAIKTAHDVNDRFKDGVYWVSLVGLNDESLIPQLIAQSLHVREVSSEPVMQTLRNDLKTKDLLIVLDNCEHLIVACAQVVEQLLAGCPSLKILATSIEALGLFNETVWQVPSLPLPESLGTLSLEELKGFASIQLFSERAGQIKPDFVLNEENAESVAQVCQRLDGIPLAIELAAARIKLLSVDEIAARLDDRFSWLTAGSRTAIPRHQTLRAAIDWSYDLLGEPEQILFRRLAVFAGGFNLEAAESICSFGILNREDVLDLLARLVDKSLAIVQNPSPHAGTRYRLLETIRLYAREKLTSFGEADLTLDRHLEFFMRLAEEAEVHHFSSEQLVWFDRVQNEIDNLRAAMDWSMTATHSQDLKNQAWRLETGLRLMGALVWFWHRNHARETSERLKQMLKLTDQPTLGRARALYALGFLTWVVNNFSEARLALEEAVTISRNLDDRLTLAMSLGYLGAVAASEGDYDSTRSLLEESLSLARELGVSGRKAASWALAFLGDVHFAQGDYEGAKPFYQEAVALAKEAQERNMLGLMIRRLGYTSLRQSENTLATEHFRESLDLNQEVGHPVGICASLTAFANLALAEGKGSQAAQLFGAVESHLRNLSSPLMYSDKIEYQLGVSNLQQEVKGAVLEKAWTKGAAMTMEQAIEFARKSCSQ